MGQNNEIYMSIETAGDLTGIVAAAVRDGQRTFVFDDSAVCGASARGRQASVDGMTVQVDLGGNAGRDMNIPLSVKIRRELIGHAFKCVLSLIQFAERRGDR